MLSASYGDAELYASVASYHDFQFRGDITSYGEIQTIRSDFRLEPRHEIHMMAIVMVSEVPSPLAAKLFVNTIAATGDAPWENLSWRDPRPVDTGPLAIGGENWKPPLMLQANGATDGNIDDDSGVTDFGSNLSAGGVANGVFDHGATGAGGRVVGFLVNNDRGNTYWQFHVGHDRFPPHVPPVVAMANYLSAISSVATSQDTIVSPLDRTTSTRDAAFDSYSTDSLLLVRDASTLDIERERDDLSEERDAESLTDEENAVDGNSFFDETAQVALGALRRERRAFEAVLEALADIPIADRETSAKVTAADPHRESPRERALGDWRYDFSPAATAAAAYDADGGMVLLEHSGDANSSVYDLTAAFASEMDTVGMGAHHLHASLGMYQAIDIGASDLNGASPGTKPITQPASAAPASVSAENAPAQKSDQPAA